jgi:uncharacterized cupredoxin-like copper-binding protein
MATITPEEPTSGPNAADDAVLARLSALEREVARGNRDARRAGNGFTIFAVAALAVSMVTLAAVLAKLDSGSTTSVRVGNAAGAGPMMRTPAAVAPAGRIAVALKEYSVGLSTSVGRAGRVTFAVRNDGTMTHEFVVLRTPKPAADLLKGNRADEAGNVGETGDMRPGAVKMLHLRLKPGHYALICNLPGHYMAGQHADFTVR